MTKLGENLKEIRKKYNLTQNDLAVLLNTSDSMISKIEKETKPNFFIKYLFFCKSKGEDLNKIFDDEYYKKFKINGEEKIKSRSNKNKKIN